MGDPRTKLPRKPIRSSDPVAHGYYKARESPEDGIVFRGWDSAVDEDSQAESGVCSPTLWGSNSPTSPGQFYRLRNRSLSPTSRTQAIARGQQELMEMVRNMPESSYELSLKDLVEHHVGNLERQEESTVERDDSSSETSFRRDPSKKRTENRALVTRSRSVDSGGFYLKMFFPLSFGPMATKKKRNSRNDSGLNGSSRVSPKPPVGDGSAKGVDRDWWRKRSSVAGESEGSVSGGSMSGSSNSTSSDRSNSRQSESQGSCWFCISPIRSKNPE